MVLERNSDVRHGIRAAEALGCFTSHFMQAGDIPNETLGAQRLWEPPDAILYFRSFFPKKRPYHVYLVDLVL